MNRRPRRRPALFLLLLLAFLALLLGRAGGGRPLALERALLQAVESPLRLAAAAAARVGAFTGELFRRERLHQRVAELEAQVARLQAQNTELAEAGRENRRLGALLALREAVGGGYRAARVIAADPTSALRSVVIDLGGDDGLSKDAAVLAADGLVGRVLKVGSRSAVVQLVTDTAGGVAAIDERSRVQGVLVGTGGLDCRLKYVPNLEDVRPGDRILASGLDGIYPRGAVIGSVAQVAPGPDAFKEVWVRPAVSSARLETVLVLAAPDASGAAAARDRLAARLPLPGAAGGPSGEVRR